VTSRVVQKLAERTTANRNLKSVIFGLSCLIVCVLSFKTLGNTDIKKIFAKHNDSSNEFINHAAWDKLLQSYVKPGSDGLNYVDYAGWKKDGTASLKAYLDFLQTVDPAKYKRDVQFAYWVNLYNAKTIDIVLEHYPVKSIKDIDISPGLFANGPWKRKNLTVSATALSLDDIEHVLLRGLWRDNRVHYALNCASIGCPNLAQRAFTGANLNEMLNKGAKEYINHPRGVSLMGNNLRVSRIYSWFSEDFGDNDREIIMHLHRFANPRLSDRLGKITKIDSYVYDWRLNEFKGQM